jgi:hypothetical protein
MGGYHLGTLEQQGIPAAALTIQHERRERGEDNGERREE